MELKQILERNIALGGQIEIFYFSTVSRAKGSRVTSHLFVVLQTKRVIFAIEILVYPRKSLSLLYVSKVDTTGCHDRSSSLISDLTYSCLEFLVSSQEGPVRLSLFAKSQPQYIFPYSSQNPGKHILDDRALIRWWIRTVNKLKDNLSTAGSCFFLIPGFEEPELKHYLPINSNWKVGHPYSSSALAKDQIPRFPDDPKSRFLDQMESEKELDTTTVESFWEQMAYRQEMSSGHVIGFISLDLEHQHSCQSDPLDITEKKYNAIYASLQRQIYTTVEDTENSTKLWLKVLYSSQAVHSHYSISGERPQSQSREILAKSTSQTRKIVTEASATTPQVNVLVPRKKVKTSR